MMQDESQALVDPSTMIADPQQLQGQLDQQFQTQLAGAPNAIARATLLQQHGWQQLRGGDPRVQQAKAQRDQLMGIMQDVGQPGDDEDPLAYQTRLSRALVGGMAHTNPNVALAAAQNLTRLQEAQIQRQALMADVTSSQNKAQLTSLQLKEAQMADKTATTYFVDPADPSKVVATVAHSNEDGSPKSADDYAQELMQARKAFPTAIAKNDQEMGSATAAAAQQKAQAGILEAQIRAQAQVQAAGIRAAAQGQAMDGRSAQMAFRVLSGAEMAGSALENVANMEFGAESPTLGNGFRSHSGESLWDGTRDSLRNQLTTQESQQYVTFAQPIWRGISAIEAQGGLQGGQQLAAQIKEGLEIHPGDTPLTILGKLAQARQDVEKGTQVQLANPKLDPGIRDQVLQAVDRLKVAVPFTVADVQKFTRAQEKNPKLTFRQFAASNGIGENVPGPTPETGTGGASGAKSGDIDAERRAANAAIAKGAPADKVRARFKQNTGQDL